MERDPSNRSSTHFSGCMASPSWLPVHRDPSRFHLLSRDAHERGRSWRSFLRRLVKEGRSIYASKQQPLTFGYDAVSYSKNFDDGCCNDGSVRCFDDAGRWRNVSNV